MPGDGGTVVIKILLLLSETQPRSKSNKQALQCRATGRVWGRMWMEGHATQVLCMGALGGDGEWCQRQYWEKPSWEGQ